MILVREDSLRTFGKAHDEPHWPNYTRVSCPQLVDKPVDNSRGMPVSDPPMTASHSVTPDSHIFGNVIFS